MLSIPQWIILKQNSEYWAQQIAEEKNAPIAK